MANEELVERRRHTRFQAYEGALAAPRTHHRKLWQIVDISKGGLAFRYIPSDENSKGSSELDILPRHTRFSLEKIPFRIVSDYKISNEHPSTDLSLRRRGVQFGELTHEQVSQLEYFIQNHTLGVV